MKKLVPKFIVQTYHFILAGLGAAFYGHPSEEMVVIGVTGTNGKSTVANIIAKVLEEGGYKVGMASTINFKIGKKEWMNRTKMTMLGRMGLQKLLRRMADKGCQYAVIETSSEGIAQFRHVGINYDVAVFTNLSPEHIERHGSFETYKRMKGKLFKSLSSGKRKRLSGRDVNKVSIVNLDDKHVEYFLKFPADRKYGFHEEDFEMKIRTRDGLEIITGEDVRFDIRGSQFKVFNSVLRINLPGKYNVYNALAAVCVGLSQDVEISDIRKALEKVRGVPGRMEEIFEGQDFTVFVDYAHNPEALRKAYETVSHLKGVGSRIIGVLGAAGGGRDKWKRPEMGKIAAQYCDSIVIANEDPYDEDPKDIIKEVSGGVLKSGFPPAKMFGMLDRREAIKKAFGLAGPGDVVLITGKGCEQCIVGPRGKKIPWDDRKVARELLREKHN